MPKHYLVRACLLLALALCSCSSGTQPAGTASPDRFGLPGISALDTLHGVSALAVSTQNGVDAAERSVGATDDGTGLVLAAGAGRDFEWGIYAFAAGTDTLVSVEVQLSAVTGAGAYVGLADYGVDRWTWFGPFTATTLQNLAATHKSPGSSFYCAVVTVAGAAATVDLVSLTTDNEPVVTGPRVLDASPETGFYNSMVIVNGHPAITYFDMANQNVRYIRALDAQGSAWGAPITLVSTGAPGGGHGPSQVMKVVNGRPAIAYWDGDQTLSYMRASDANGDAWGAPQVIDPTFDSGDYPSLEIVAGHPAVAYHNFNGDAISYIRATDADGTTWGAPVDAAGPLGTTTFSADAISLAVVNGRPAIAYLHHGTETLAFTRANDDLGATWGAPITLDTDTAAGYFVEIIIAGGVPVVAYHNLDVGDLRFMRASNADGSAWNTPQIIDTVETGVTTSLALIGGLPSIAYYDIGQGRLRYIQATNAAGTAWGAPVTLDDDGDVGSYSALVELPGGGPGVAYQDRENPGVLYLNGF